MVRSCITAWKPRQSSRQKRWNEWHIVLCDETLYPSEAHAEQPLRRIHHFLLQQTHPPLLKRSIFKMQMDLEKWGNMENARKRKTCHDSILNSLHKQFFTISNMRIMFSFSRFRPYIIFAFPSFPFSMLGLLLYASATTHMTWIVYTIWDFSI